MSAGCLSADRSVGQGCCSSASVPSPPSEPGSRVTPGSMPLTSSSLMAVGMLGTGLSKTVASAEPVGGTGGAAGTGGIVLSAAWVPVPVAAPPAVVGLVAVDGLVAVVACHGDEAGTGGAGEENRRARMPAAVPAATPMPRKVCLLYTSDAA